VLNVSPLLRQLLMEAVELPAAYDRQGRDGLLMRLVLSVCGPAARNRTWISAFGGPNSIR
jgi:hypothetical protein